MNAFYHNLSKGAFIDQSSDPDLQLAGRNWARHLSRATGIDLAGIDFLFPLREGQLVERPLFLEINYFFGRSGLGGSKNFYQHLQEASLEWLDRIGCN